MEWSFQNRKVLVTGAGRGILHTNTIILFNYTIHQIVKCIFDMKPIRYRSRCCHCPSPKGSNCVRLIKRRGQSQVPCSRVPNSNQAN